MDIKINKSMFQPPKKSALSIFIGSESSEIVHLKRTIKGITVAKKIYKDIKRKDISGTTIKDILKTEGITETTISTTLPEESLVLRRFSMPLIPPKDRPAAIRFEAKKHIPFAIDEIISGYHIINENRTINKMDVLFLAAKKEDIYAIRSLMKDADLTIERIEPISLALINTLTQTGSLIENFPPSAILYFSSKAEAHFIIAENGIPYLKREFTLSGKGTIEEQILNELRLSFSYYKREFPEKNITKVIICGLKEKPSWLDTVKASLNTPAEYSTPLKVMAEVDVPNPQLEVGLGLAISRLTKQKIDINFLPEEAIPSKINIKAIAISAIAVSVGILALLYLKQIPPVSKLKQQVLTAEAKKIKVEELALSQKSMEELNTLKTTWQQKRDILFTYTKNRMNWHEKLMKLVHVIPKESWITQLTLGDSAAIPGARVFILKGSTYTPDPNMEIEITNNFSNKLKKDEIFMKGFKRLTLGTINKTTIASYEVANFDISLTSD